VISVVIPARNAAHELPRTLGPLAEVEVVVVANGCSDDTAEVARAHGTKVVELERANRAAARNRGAQEASGDRLLFTDAGVVPSAAWAEALGACLEGAPLAGGAIEVSASKAPNATEHFDLAWRFHQERTIRDGGWSAGANLGITREALEDLGGFTEGLRAGDDVDLCMRARERGHAIAYCPDAVVTHPASQTLRQVARRGFRQGASATVLHRRHAGRAGYLHWRHPGGIVRGRAALLALGVDPAGLDPKALRPVTWVARIDYASRVAGSWAALILRPWVS
jgi:GT2 family glycosyltransferase